MQGMIHVLLRKNDYSLNFVKKSILLRIICTHSVFLGGGSYQDGVNFDRLPSVDDIGKEMQALPANTATRINEGADRRDDVLYFSI